MTQLHQFTTFANYFRLRETSFSSQLTTINSFEICVLRSTLYHHCVLGADVMLRDLNNSTCLHMALGDHSTVDFSSFPKLRKSSPQDLDQSPAIAKVLLHCCCCFFIDMMAVEHVRHWIISLFGRVFC